MMKLEQMLGTSEETDGDLMSTQNMKKRFKRRRESYVITEEKVKKGE